MSTETVLMNTEKVPRSKAAIAVGSGGFLLVAGYAVIGALQILVLDPMAAVPGSSLADIYTGAARANETIQVWWVVCLMGFGLALAIGSLVLSFHRGATWVQSAAVASSLLFFGAAPYFWAGLGVGMNIADAFGTDGGDHTGWSSVLWRTSGCAGLVLVMLAIGVAVQKRVERLRARREAAAHQEFTDSAHSEA